MKEDHYKKIFDSIGYAMISVDLDNQQIIMANTKAEKLFQIPSNLLCKKKFSDLFEIKLVELLKEGQKSILLKDIPVVLNAWEYEFTGRRFAVCLLREITKEAKADEEIKLLTRLYNALSFINQLITTVEDENSLFKNTCSILKNKARFKYVGIFKKGKEKALFDEGSYTNEDPVVCVPFKSNRDEYTLNVAIPRETMFTDKEKLLLEEVAADLSFALSKIKRQERLSHIAYYDEVTYLPNRIYFHQRLKEMISKAKIITFKVVLIMMLIDNFAKLEYNFGHHFIKELVKAIASKIKDKVRDRDLIARIEKDGFAIAIESSNPNPIIESLIKRIRKAFSDPLYINGNELSVTVSFGVATFPYDAESPEELISNAMLSAKKAQELGGDRAVFYSEELTKQVKDRIAIRTALRNALSKKEFKLYYQPKIDLHTGMLTGAEALIRWIKDGQVIPPYKFIPILEESELIQKVGKWVIEEACDQMKEWQKKGAYIHVAVNISPVQLSVPSFIEELISTISLCKADGLEVEITESAMMEDISKSISFLNELLNMGIKSYIDDFGTGYSSLAYLKKLPVYAIKIDREFVKDIPENKEDIEIIRATIGIAKIYKIKTVAEGVETEEQVKLLKELGCDYAQGYYFSRPLPADQFTEYMLSFGNIL